MSTADGRSSPPKKVITISRDLKDKLELKKPIFSIINALLQMMGEYMHNKDNIHNDLHLANVFMHFYPYTNKISARISDRGRVSHANMKKHDIPVQSDGVAQRVEAKQSGHGWHWVSTIFCQNHTIEKPIFII